MLPEHRRRPPRAALRAVDQDRMTYTLQAARGLVFVLDNNAAGFGVWMVKQLSDRIDGRAGNTDGCQRVVPVCGGMLRNHGLDVTEGLLAVRHAIRVGLELRIVDDGVQSHYSAKLAPQIIIRDADHDRAVGRLEGLIGTKRLVA